MTEEQTTESVPAKDPGVPFSTIYLSQYLALEPTFTGWTRNPRAAITMRQKLADIALSLTQIIVYKSEARSEQG